MIKFDQGQGDWLYAWGDFAGFDGATAPILKGRGAGWMRADEGLPPGTSVSLLLAGNSVQEGLFAVCSNPTQPSVWLAILTSTGWVRLADPVPGFVTATAGCFASGQSGVRRLAVAAALSSGLSQVVVLEGNQWLPLGPAISSTVDCMTEYDDGTGPALYVSAGAVLRLTSDGWSVVGTPWRAQGAERIVALSAMNSGPLRGLYAAGRFTSISSVVARNVARWDGSSWNPILHGRGMDGNFSLIPFDSGTGVRPHLVGVGAIEDRLTTGWLRWTGTAWEDAHLNFPQSSTPIFDHASGTLYLGGRFTTDDGRPARVLRTNPDHSLTPIDAGATNNAPTLGSVAVLDFGAGPVLFASDLNATSNAGAVGPWNVCAFSNGSWQPVIAGLRHPGELLGRVATIIAFNGSLYACGRFQGVPPGAAGQNIARWDGRAWSAVGSAQFGELYDMEVFDAGDGPRLYVAGFMNTTSSAPEARGVAAWDGTVWRTIGTLPGANALQIISAGPASGLYAGGRLRQRNWWDNSGLPCTLSIGDGVACGYAGASGPQLLWIGHGGVSGATVSASDLAIWSACPQSDCPADLTGDGRVTFQDLLDFLGLWLTGDSRADIDHCGQVDLRDLQVFLDIYVVGCG